MMVMTEEDVGENEQRAYRLGFLRAKNPEGWEDQDDITHGDALFYAQMNADIVSDYPEGWNRKTDGCVFCFGVKGGTPGNENLLHGRKICDYCTRLIDAPSSSELVGVVVDALGLPRLQPELILRGTIGKLP